MRYLEYINNVWVQRQTMSGVTKHIYEADVRDIQEMWSKQLKKIETVLPSEYDEKTIVELLKKYYPHEWKSVECKKWYYDKKDKSIVKRKGKPRYHMPDAERLLRENFKFKKMCSSQQQQIHALIGSGKEYHQFME